MKMKIVAGLGALDDFQSLSAAGADEVFVGYVPGRWYERYSDFLPINRREVRLQSIQIDTMGDMRLLRDMAADTNTKVAVTFNAPIYAPEQHAVIADIMADLHAIGYDRWIVADPALMCTLTRMSVPGKLHLSGEAGAFTADAALFFAHNFPIARLIYPRRTSIEEMRACRDRLPNIEREAFVLNEKCHFSGAFCMSAHCDALDALCRVDYCAVGKDFRRQTGREPQGKFGESGCAVCVLDALRDAGITHLKVVGRGAHPEDIRRDVAQLRRALAMPSEERIAVYSHTCAHNCYYPMEKDGI